jgi:phosphoribosylamine--glycine ligase
VEEKLVGVEFSLLSFVSRTQLIDMPAVQDHKRAFEGDAGPNTGGMGTFTDSNHSLPFLERSDLEQASAINRSIAEAVMKECGHPYRGILYGGFMAVKDGIRVIEYNARFGDPEALNLLSLLESDFVDLCLSMIEGSLTPSLAQFARKASVCTYIVPRSYPDAKNERGQPVSFPDIPSSTARIYYGDIAEADNNDLLLGGSRTAGIVGIADTIDEAQRTVCSLCEQVKGPVRFRADIGTDQLIRQRIDFMHSLRA